MRASTISLTFTRILPTTPLLCLTPFSHLSRCYGLGCLRLQKYVPLLTSTAHGKLHTSRPPIRYTSFDQLHSKLLTAAAEGGRYEVA